MSRPERIRTNPGLGYSHSEDHCDLCAAQASWASSEAEQATDRLSKLEERIARLERKRADSEIRDQVADQRARFWIKVLGVVATGGAAPWVWKGVALLVKQMGG